MHNNDELLSNFAPYMRANIRHLCLTGKLGLIPLTINDITVMETKLFSFGYRLKLKIPYAGKRLLWEVIFDPEDPDFAPDFQFNDDTFLCNLSPDFYDEHVPSWNAWDLQNPESLTNVLKDFLELYKKFQLGKIMNDNIYAKVKDEYEGLVEKKKGLEGNIEVMVDNNNVHLLIGILVDFKAIPDYIQADKENLANPGDDYILLRMSYLGVSKIAPSLFVSPRIEQILSVDKVVPQFNRDMSLLKYYEGVLRMLTEKIRCKEADYQRRLQFMSYLLTVDPSKVIDYDQENLMSILMIVTVDDYEYALEISVEYQFPDKKPKIVLYHDCEKADCKEIIRNIPWMKNENKQKMLNNILNFLQEELPRLRKNHKH